MGKGRTSRLTEPGVRETLADLYARGADRKEMGEFFGVHVDTISTWTREPETQALAEKIMRERANRIKRKIDNAIEGRLQDIQKLDVETLLKIRKEFVPQSLDITSRTDKADLTEELWKAADANPELAEALGRATESSEE